MADHQVVAEQQGVDERHVEITTLVRNKGFATIEELSQHFGVTVQTIRRDLNRLDKEGLLIRHHGGAAAQSSVENVSYSQRRVSYFDEKERIARLVASHIPENSSLFLNIGTTTEAVARALTDHKGLRVITNNINVATILSQNTDFQVFITGGRIRNRDGGILGQDTCVAIEQFRVDYGIIGISGIDLDGTMLDFDYDEVRAAQAIIRSARQTFLVTDHSKFSRRPMVRLGSLTEISAIYTDATPPKAVRSLMAANEVALHIATGDGTKKDI